MNTVPLSTAPFLCASMSKIGGRQDNEDSRNFIEVGNAACWVVADGLGGHHGGKAASSIAVETILASFASNPDLSAETMAVHFRAAHHEILKWQKKDPSFCNMQTTVVVLLADLHTAIWGHVGDSRLYCIEGGRIAFHTEDHSVLQAMAKAGDIALDDIRHHRDRSRLLRALGSRTADPRPTILKHKHPLSDASAFLLCTDGFWEYVTECEMEVDLAKSANPQEWLTRMESRLIARAPGDHDNYTAMAVSPKALVPLPAQPRQSIYRKVKPHRDSAKRTGLALLLSLLFLLIAAGLAALMWTSSPVKKSFLALFKPWGSVLHIEDVNNIKEAQTLPKAATDASTELSPILRISNVSLFDSERNRVDRTSSDRFPASQLQGIYYQLSGINLLYGKADLKGQIDVSFVMPDGKIPLPRQGIRDSLVVTATKSQREWKAGTVWEPEGKRFIPGKWRINFSWKRRSIYTKYFDVY